jgi:galactoside O-acetyltransferase
MVEFRKVTVRKGEETGWLREKVAENLVALRRGEMREPLGKLMTFLRRCFLLPWWKMRFAHFGAYSSIERGVVVTMPRMVSIGKHTTIYHRCFITVGYKGKVEIGDYSHLGVDVYLNADEGCIKIGNYVAVGPKSGIYSYSNYYEPGKFITQCYKVADVTIEDDVWIGAGAVILPGVTISRGAIVGANAVITKDVAPYSIVGGVPAREIGKRPE